MLYIRHPSFQYRFDSLAERADLGLSWKQASRRDYL